MGNSPKNNQLILSKSKIFMLLCLSFIFSIALASFSPYSMVDCSFYFFIALVSFFVLAVLFWQNKIVRLFFLAGLFIFLAFWRYGLSLPSNSPDKIWFYNGVKVEFVGIIIKEPDVRQNSIKYTVEATRINSQRQEAINGRVLITGSLYPSYNYGDELELNCTLKTPTKFEDFFYDRYLARYNIYSVCYFPQIKLLDSNRGNWFLEKIFLLKNKLRSIIDYGLPEPANSVAKALILGDKRGIDSDLREKFNQAGVSHILAISGMHISIFGALILSFFIGLGLPRRKTFYASSLFLLFYIVLIGLPASAIRAGIIGFLVLWAVYLGRLNKLINSLIMAATVLLLFNPRLLRDDIGFQLSFLAVLGIIYFYPLINSWLDRFKVPKFKGLRDILSLSLAAQIFVLPIIAYNFSQISLISPFANLLIIWTLPVLMILITVALALSLLFVGLSPLLFAPALLVLNYILFCVDFLVKLPLAYVEIGSMWWGLALAYWLAIGLIIFFFNKKID